MRRRVIKRVHSNFRFELCLLTHTEEEEEKTGEGGGVGGLVWKLSLTQIAVIVSVPQASSQKGGGGVWRGEKVGRWGEGPTGAKP